MDEYYKRSGQIPPFGNWDYANDLPITQYFQCARQAGLTTKYTSSCGTSRDLSAAECKKFSLPVGPPRKTRVREKGSAHVKEHRKQGRVYDVTEQPRKQHLQAQARPQMVDASYHNHHHYKDPPPSCPNMPKPVDEDLYKIPPEFLHSSKRKKKLGFISRCLVPACHA